MNYQSRPSHGIGAMFEVSPTELLSDWELAISEENENELVVLNPPMVRHENPTVLTGRE